jgi:hypothetical protein
MARGEIFTDLPSLLGVEAKKAAGQKIWRLWKLSLATPRRLSGQFADSFFYQNEPEQIASLRLHRHFLHLILVMTRLSTIRNQ